MPCLSAGAAVAVASARRTVEDMKPTPDESTPRRWVRRWAKNPYVAGAVLLAAIAGAVLTLQLLSPDGPQVRTDTAPLPVVLDLLDRGGADAATLDDLEQSVTVTVGGEHVHRVHRQVVDEKIRQRAALGLPELDDDEVAELREDRVDEGTAYRVEAGYPVGYREVLANRLIDDGLPLVVDPIRAESFARVMVRTLLPTLMILIVILYLIRTMGAGGKLFGSKAKASEIPDARFDDVAGADEAVADLRDAVAYLHDPDRFTRFGARGPKGLLLEGPPGTGKTLLARAVAGEAGVPFFAVAGSDFVEMFAGRGASRVRDLFAEAGKAGTAVIFIDEIDAVGRTRTSGGGGGTGADREADQTLIALLNEMDGFTSSGIIVMAATNRSDMLDKALTRPGRFDRKINVPNPDRAGRARILQIHAADKPFDDDLDLDVLAGRTTGMSGADLANVINEAAVIAARDDAATDTITARHLEEAYQTVTLGRARVSALVTGPDKTITAWHEAGHAIAALMQPDAPDPVTVDIIPRGPAGGVTWMEGNDDVFLRRSGALAQLNVALAGRAAEELLLDDDYTQGAAGDLESATNLAFNMATRFGMTGTLAVYNADRYAAGGSSEALDGAVEELLQHAQEQARALVRTYRPQLETLVGWLLEVEHVEAARLQTLRDDATAASDDATTVTVAGSLALDERAGGHGGR